MIDKGEETSEELNLEHYKVPGKHKISNEQIKPYL